MLCDWRGAVTTFSAEFNLNLRWSASFSLEGFPVGSLAPETPSPGDFRNARIALASWASFSLLSRSRAITCGPTFGEGSGLRISEMLFAERLEFEVRFEVDEKIEEGAEFESVSALKSDLMLDVLSFLDEFGVSDVGI